MRVLFEESIDKLEIRVLEDGGYQIQKNDGIGIEVRPSDEGTTQYTIITYDAKFGKEASVGSATVDYRGNITVNELVPHDRVKEF